MKTAKEMFEDLGFEKREYPERDLITYTREGRQMFGGLPYRHKEKIAFLGFGKSVLATRHYIDDTENQGSKLMELNARLVCAVYKQIEELGWI